MQEQIRLLCVDDEANVLHALERFFIDDDFEIFTANSGEDGLKLLEENGPFQVVISDYRMPVMNGVEFLKEVFARWPDTIRIVLSGYADAGAIVAAINEGQIYKFIPKPWDDNELRFTINASLERYRLQKQNRELLEALSVSNAELEQRIQERTADLELRNTALRFSQLLLNALPVGVLGVDVNGMIILCNEEALKILAPICRDFIGADIKDCCECGLGDLFAKVLENGTYSEMIKMHGKCLDVIGSTFSAIASQAVVLVVQETKQT